MIDKPNSVHVNPASDDGTSDSGAVHVGGVERFTMAEAARMKGVSYHTVSRAVRRGRLPVQRIGRMALIAADDLRNWMPMRERAPRKYQQRSSVLSPEMSLLHASGNSRSDLLDRFASIIAEIDEASMGSSMDLVTVVHDQLRQAFALERVAIWRFDAAMHVADRLIRSETLVTRFPGHVRILDFPFLRSLTVAHKARMILDPKAEDPEISAYFTANDHLGSAVFAPLRRGEQLLGLIVGDRDGNDFDLTEEQLSIVQRVADHAAAALESTWKREELELRNRILESIIDDLPSSVAATDAKGIVIVSNRVHSEMLGIPSALAMPFQQLAGKLDARWDDPANATREVGLLRILAGEEVPPYDYQVVRDGSAPRTYSLSHRPIEFDGELIGAVSVATDITTSREHAERREQDLRELKLAARKAETVATVVAEMNTGKSVQDVIDITLARLVDELEGDSGVVMLGGTRGAFIHRGAYKTRLPAAYPLTFDPISQPNTILSFARRSPVYVRWQDAGMMEQRLMELIGWQSMLIVPFQLEDERLGFSLVGYASARDARTIDTTFAATLGRQCAHALDKVRLIDELEDANRRLHTLIDQLPQAILIVNHKDGVVTIANKAAEELWGFTLEDQEIRASQLLVLDPDGLPYDADHHPLLRSGRTGRAYLGEPMTILRPDGESMEVMSNHAPVYSASGAITGAVSILQDRAHFKPLDRVKDEFLSVAAHELRNPLTSLKGNVQLLERRVKRDGGLDEEEALKRVGTIAVQVDRIASLVSRLLDISRADLGRLDVTLGPADAAVLVRGVADEAAGMFTGREIRVHTPERVPVVWDQVRIEQILMNLLTNASLYAPNGPIEIELKEDPASDRIEISVRDHGDGIPATIRPRLFKQYYRFDDGRTDDDRSEAVSHGLGIGLYLSQRIAIAHGGELRVDDAPGGGAIFTVVLPREAEEASASM